MDDINLKILACNMRRALRAPEECDIPWMLETAARELDRLRMLQTAADEMDRLKAENERLRIENDHNAELMGKLDDEAWRVLTAIGNPMPRWSSFWEAATELPAEVERLRAENDRWNRRVADQIRWANDRACEAEGYGDNAGKEAWYGYVNALRWIQTLLPAEPLDSRTTST